MPWLPPSLFKAVEQSQPHWGRLTWSERGKGKNRKGGSLSVAREEKVKDVCLFGYMHHLGGEWAGKEKVGLWFICPSSVG